jgi:uncharacterized membrane protein (DUF373 family)
MRFFQRLSKQISTATEDNNFLHGLETIEVFISKILSIAMVIVILVSVYDLGVVLYKELFMPSEGFFKETLFKIFGLFLNVLIAFELLENITAYLKKHVIQVELVIVTSLIAVARKIIILDLEKKTAMDLIGLAIAIFALSISYFIIKRVNSAHERRERNK